MKKIIVSFLVSLVCFLGYAQTPYPSPNPFGSKGTMTQAQGGWKIDSTAIMPVYADTFAANRSKTSLYPGALIRVSDDYYYRSADTSKWLLLATTTSNCAGTQLISGSITWSGSGLVYDATDLDYYILCSRYFANSTTLTLATADPTFPRIDKFYADITGNIGVITGTPSANPQEPAINPLTQIDMGFVYIPAGSTVPAGTTQTVIYNENVEWTGTSDVPSINFAYATNPYIGSLSTYIPSAPNDSYISWQYGTTKRFIDVQYLKLWVRINEAFVSRPSPFLDVSFYNGSTKVSADSYVEDGVYNFDFNLIGEWQLVSIPLQGLVVSDSIFDKVNFVIHSAPTSFQLDYVYLLETATVPPAPVGGTWLLNGNSSINDATQYIGTRDAKKLNLATNGQIRAYIDTAGIELLGDTTANVMLIDSNGKIWKTYQPTILADSPLVIYQDVYQKHIKADTTRHGSGLATQYYADSVANAGGGIPTWQQTLTAGSVITSNINSTSPTGRRFIYKTDAVLDSRFTRLFIDTVQTSLSHYSATYGSSGMSMANDTVALVFFTNSSLANAQAGASKSYSFLNYWNNISASVDSIKLLGVDNDGAFFSYNNQRYTFPLTQPTTGQVLTSISGATLGWASGGSPALTNTYVGVGNGAGISGGPDLTFDGGILRTVGINMAGGDMDSVSNIFGGSYYGIWAGDPVGEVYGGTGQSAYTTGDLIYASATNTLSKLGIGTAAQSLKVVGGIPAWKDTLAVSGVYALINANTTGSAGTLATPRKINGVDFNGSADISTDIFTKAYQSLGSTIVAQNVDGQLPTAMTNLTMISQRSYWSLVYLPVATTLTGVKWKQVTAGVYTANNYNGVGLYSISGGTLTLVASSTDDGNIWKATGSTIGSKAFSSTYAAAAGAYMVVALHSSSANTTSPVIAALTGASGFVNQVWDFTNSAKSSGLISSLTALPSPTQAFSGITTSGAEVWFGLY